MSVRGFILQPTYRIEAGRPIVHLYGKLESGQSFLVRDDRQVPHFFIKTADVARAQALGANPIVPCPYLTLGDQPVAQVNLATPPDAPPLRDLLQQHGILTYEADVRFAMSYLIERGLRGAIAIAGEGVAGTGVDWVYTNPELTPAAWTPRLNALSLDIETDPQAKRLLSIALHGCGAAEVLLFCPKQLTAPVGARPFARERDLLAAFVARVRELDPDILTGWNVIDFDLQVLERLARQFGIRLDLGRGSEPLRLRPFRGPWGGLEAIVPGRLVLDGVRLLRGAFVKLDGYSLNRVAQEILGRGKVLQGQDRAQQIVDTFLHDRPRFVAYNLTDAQLVSEILEKLQLLELSVERSSLTGLPLDRVQGSIAAFDFLYLAALKQRGRVAPSVQAAPSAGVASPGGHLLEPQPGLYRTVWVFDFKSLYPSLIRTFQIDPLGHVPRPRPEDDLIVAPNRAAFRREPGILPQMLDQLFPRREAAKAAGNRVLSHAIKILMNSFYGVLGTPACRFFRPEIAGAITSFGREILLWSEAWIERQGLRVLYGDTDSLFVLAPSDDPEQIQQLGQELAVRLNQDLAVHLQATYRVESRLELELKEVYSRLLLPSVRHGSVGARKRYVGQLGEGDDARVVFTGMEVVRRDWTELAKQVQRELYTRLFAEREVETYLRDTVRALRQGGCDDLLVYRKALRKGLADYTATTPPHVAAARKSGRTASRLVSYVVTHNGPEPANERKSAFDYEHYVQKQVRPVAEPVLAILGLDFDRAIGDNAQLELFAR